MAVSVQNIARVTCKDKGGKQRVRKGSLWANEKVCLKRLAQWPHRTSTKWVLGIASKLFYFNLFI